jgi:predicted Zn finger-like uncharacterized protein
MYFVCPACKKALRVDATKIPSNSVKYSCKKCGEVSLVRDHLFETPPSDLGSHAPGTKAFPEKPDAAADDPVPPSAAASVDGTVYHHVGNLTDEVPRATYELRCVVKASAGNVKKYSFQKSKITIGRGETDIVLDDPLVSRVHAELEKVKGTVLVKDLDSTNGTYVNDKKVTAQVLQPGDVLRVGNTLLKAAARLRDP